MKTAIIGSRTIVDYNQIKNILDQSIITEIISGGAKGVDQLAEQYSLEKNIPITIIKPDWQKYGRAAGPIRNREIVTQSEKVIAFWDAKSAGTASSIEIAIQQNKLLEVWIIQNGIFILVE